MIKEGDKIRFKGDEGEVLAFYKNEKGPYYTLNFKGKKFPDGVDSVLLDTLFWQSLGKAMGWEKENVYHFIGGTLCEHCERGKPEWQQVWRRFIDHLAEGGTPESFFSQL